MRKGFTLLELMIVIIIIGSLSAIGVTQYSKAIVNAKNAQAKAVLGEMRKAALAYNSLYGGWPPTGPAEINVDFDNELPITYEVTFDPPTGAATSHTFSTNVAGSGWAARKAGSAGICNYRIYYDSGSIGQDDCNP